MVRDPVCRMLIDEKRTVLLTKYKGKSYFFCAPDCKRAFEKDPDRYLETMVPRIDDVHSHQHL